MASDKFDLFGDPFDINGDGKVDIGEEFVAFMMFNEMMKGQENESGISSWDPNDYNDNDYIDRPSGNSSDSSQSYDEGPSTEGFYDPEDFYDWYRDDFIDLEEAEDYYYSHGGI